MKFKIINFNNETFILYDIRINTAVIYIQDFIIRYVNTFVNINVIHEAISF